jgi:hypothetical protein
MTIRSSRRSFLRAGAVAGVALPFLRILGLDPSAPRIAHAGPTSPKRFVFVYIPSGISSKGGEAEGTGWTRDIGQMGASPTQFTLGAFLKPLEALKNDLVILDGIDMMASAQRLNGPRFADEQNADTHTQGTVLLLTTGGFQAACGGPTTCDSNGGALGVKYASVDQYIARKIGTQTRIASLELGVQSDNTPHSLSFSGPGTGTNLPYDQNPVHVYQTLFGNFTSGAGPDPAALARIAMKKSVLDNVTADLADLQKMLGAEDRAKFDQHLTSVRSLEQRLSGGTPSCTKPPAPSPLGNLNQPGSYPAILKAHTDALFNGFACDLTRVATIQMRGCYNYINLDFNPLNVANFDHHLMSHQVDNAAGLANFQKLKAFEYEQVGALAQRLKNTQEADGSGSMLDNTLMVIGSEIAEGHHHNRMPFVTLGGKNMGVQTGRYLRVANQPHNKLWVSVLNAMGIADNSFGSTQYGIGPLAGFRV